MQFFEKPLDQITLQDISWLIENEVREGQTFELKGALSADKGTVEPWTSGENKIGRTAVASLVRELVSFTNSQGGTLVLGVAEGGERPARATAITPVRAAIQLAERLKRTCPDNFDPPVYGFEIAGIETEDDGSGVVVMRIPASPYGPHRSRADKECYVRRNDEAMAIGMDEIQRRVIEASQQRDKADEWFQKQRPVAASGWAIKACARPLGSFFVPNIHRTKAAKPRIEPFRFTDKSGNRHSAEMWCDGLNWTPIVRGTRHLQANYNGSSVAVSAFEDGSLVFDWRWPGPFEAKQKVICMDWFMATFANLVLAIERLRLATKLRNDFEAEVHVLVLEENFVRRPYWDNWYSGMSGGKFAPGAATLGRYPVSAPDSFEALTYQFETDVHHLAEVDNPDATTFDYASYVDNLRREFAEV